MNQASCFITLLTIELAIPHARSLKDKRAELRRLKDRIGNSFNASVAEVGYRDKWQRSVLAVCMVSGDRRHLESDCSRIRTLCQQATEIVPVTIAQQWL